MDEAHSTDSPERDPPIPDTTGPAPGTTRRGLHLVRLILALVLTPSVLIYNYGVVLVYGMMDGRLPQRELALLAGGIALVMILTAGLSLRLASPRLDRIVAFTTGGLWLLVTTLLIVLRSGELMPRAALLALFVPSSFWVGWVAWMFYRPWSWRTRLGLLLICVAAVVPFLQLVEVAGLTGAANVNFVWRRSAPPELAIENPAALLPMESKEAADFGQTTAHDFPQFLGPERSGVVNGLLLSPDWQGRPPRELWRQPVGEGWGAFAVVGEYCVTQEQKGDHEAIVCRRLSDGATVWIHSYPARFDTTDGGSNMGGTGPRTTPTIARGRVYAVGATGIFHCLDGKTGSVLWTTDIQKDNDGHTISHGICASPLVVADRVIVAPTGNAAACLAAYDAETGKRIWHAGKHPTSYGSPALAELGGRRQILLYTDDGIEAHDLATGEFLWDHTWTNHVRVNCSQPLIIDGAAGQVLVSTGYDNGSVLLEVRAGETEWSVREIWKSPREMKTKFTTAVRLGDSVYGLDDGILACLDLETGKRRWKAGRYQHGQILLAGELLLVQAESGDVVLVRPNPRALDELGRIPALSGKTWNNLALAGRKLLVRHNHEAACFELPTEGESP
jgi:outer membrane protein assembly factor BamB